LRPQTGLHNALARGRVRQLTALTLDDVLATMLLRPDPCAAHARRGAGVKARDIGQAAGSPLFAGALYFGLVFAIGFVLGTARTLWVEDTSGSGRLHGVLIELPIMLGASWFACLWVVRRRALAPAVVARATMGAVALTLLLLAEYLLGAMLFGRTPAEHLALYRQTSHALGLAAQIAFALMPLVQACSASKPAG
jgi:hypothetical protein